MSKDVFDISWSGNAYALVALPGQAVKNIGEYLQISSFHHQIIHGKLLNIHCTIIKIIGNDNLVLFSWKKTLNVKTT